MNRAEKILFLNRHGVSVPAHCANVWLDAEMAKFENRVVNYTGGKISVAFCKADETPVEVMVYQDIGDDPWSGNEGFTAKIFSDALKDIPKTRALDMRINSAGGSVWEGLAIKTLLNEWQGKKTASIDGMAASVASWLAMDKSIELRAPRHAQMFIHDAWGMCMGNAEDMRAQAADLDTTSQQIAQIYADKSGKTVDECRSLMKANSLFTAEMANQMGFIDRLTDDEPVQNFTAKQINNMTARLVALNKLKQPAQQGGHNTPNQMNRKQKIALLNRWGISTSKNATDKWLDQMINAAKAFLENAVTFKNGKDGDHDEDCNCADCAMKNAPEPMEEAPDPDADDGAGGDDESAEYKAATANATKATKRMNKFLANQRKQALQTSFDKFVTAGRMGANEVANWMELALAAEDTDEGANPILDRLEKTLPVNLPGQAPLNIVELGESDDIKDLDKTVKNLMEAQAMHTRNGRGPDNQSERVEVSRRSREVSRLINRFKKYEGGVTKNSCVGELPKVTGPLVDMWNKFVNSPRNANTMSTQLLRQVILSEVMRAFRRQFASLEIFAHNFGSVPLEGTDVVNVPYYPLSTTASTEFTYANGYVINPNAQTLFKTVTVGGIGNGVATPGSGRKYQPLAFTAYEIRRQPWLDIQKLSIMAGEQLAIDVRADIIGTQINAANFGNAIYTGNAGGFDHTIVGNVLLQAAIKGFWPLRGRNVVLAPGYYTNLAIDPAITPLLAIGTTDVLREGIVGGLYGFENIIHDPLLPVANSIRGGDGAVTAGTDPNLAGFMAWPSAVLIATAPIMPPPGVLKKLVSYEQITDDQTGLAFTYQFWGDESKNRDNEIIECSYGSGLGELAALYRLTSAGN